MLLQRFAQFIEQPCVLDGDNSLGGEILHQFDLLVSERADLLPINDDSADQLPLLEHRHDKNCAKAAEFYGRYEHWIAVDIGLICGDVGNVNHFFRIKEP